MYGLLLEAIAETIKAKYGEQTWLEIRRRAQLNVHSFSAHQVYSELLLPRLAEAASDVTDETVEDIMDLYGVSFVTFIGKYGYDRILRVLGRHMRDFLNGLDNLHEYMRFSYPKLRPPSFFVENESATGLRLHYRSKRRGYLHYVKGQIREVGRVFYNIDIKISVYREEVVSGMTHVTFDLSFDNKAYKADQKELEKTSNETFKLRSDLFVEVFPFHIIFNQDMKIISSGKGLDAVMQLSGTRVNQSFELLRPLMNFCWESVTNYTNNVFELCSVDTVTRYGVEVKNEADGKKSIDSGVASDGGSRRDTVTSEHDFENHLRLKGQMMHIAEWNAIMFLGTPVMENLDAMFRVGLYINDLSMHDSSRDLVLAGTQQSAELKLALDQERLKTKALEDSMKKLDVEMRRTDELLYQMIPQKVADRLRSGEPAMNLCEVFESVSILFSDVVSFTQTCSVISPMQVVSMLNEMYTKFDSCTEMHSVYKVETIGDAYMVVSGAPEENENHAVDIVDMAFDMLTAISTLTNPATQKSMQIRIGIHSGTVVAGVVGLKMPRYCLFGDTVNTASRMESNSLPMCIHISDANRALLPKKAYKIEERGRVSVKGKGDMPTFFITCKLDKDGNEIHCPFHAIMNDAKQKDVKSYEQRGYSPVSADEVHKSMTSLRDNEQVTTKDSTFKELPPSKQAAHLELEESIKDHGTSHIVSRKERSCSSSFCAIL